MKKYEFLDHTADVRVRIQGTTIQELFQNTAEALFSMLVDYVPKKKEQCSVVLEASSVEELLVNWLNELISLFFANKFLPADYSLTIENKNNAYMLTAKLEGENFNSKKYPIKDEIKAATYHGLVVSKNTDGFSAEVIFDV